MAATAPTVENELRGSRSRLTKGGRRITYQMSVLQQPERARACGQGAKSTTDRRPVDPPPIIDLRIFEGEEGHLTDITFNYCANIFLFASLENARPTVQSRSNQPASGVPVLTGTPVAGISYLDRPNPAGYFIFPDLSVRHEGKYRLSFTLFEELKDPKDEDSANQLASNTTYIHARCEVKTAPFTVFSAKKFPGLMESTSLSRMVADQGCRVRIRRDVRMRRRESKTREKWDGYEDETAHERAKRETSPVEYTQPQVTTQAQAPPLAQTSTAAATPANNSNNTTYNSSSTTSSDAIRHQDVTPSYPAQIPNHQPQQQITQNTQPAYPSYLPYDTAQMQHYMSQHPGFAQYPQQATAYTYPGQPMMSFHPGYTYMPQHAMHQAPMYDHMQHHAAEYMPPPLQPPPPPPPPTYPRQSVATATAYSGQAQSQEGNEMRQGQPSDQNYLGQMSMTNMAVPAPPKGLPRLPSNGVYPNRISNGMSGLQQQTYPDPARSTGYYSQPPSSQKRSHAAAFENPSHDQYRVQYPSRPQTSTCSRPSEQDGPSPKEDQSSDAESLELEQLKMTYRRADGTQRTRTWPQLRT